MLILEIAYLRDVAVAAAHTDPAAPEWPPHPDRLFSALVAAWAERGGDPAERAALSWLERLDPPTIHAAAAEARTTADHYVPPNDMTVSGKPGRPIPKDMGGSLAVLPALRKNRQPRQFPAVVPEDARVRFVWPDATGAREHTAALAALMAGLTYLGHSSSLIRGAILHPDTAPDDGDRLPAWTPVAEATARPGGTVPMRVPFPGRLDQLETGHAEAANADPPFRPPVERHQAYRRPDVETAVPPPASVFGDGWIVLGDDGGTTPDLSAFPAVAARLRAAIMSKITDPVPEVISGHQPDGTPSRDPHLAILPLADTGWRHSRGRLMGMALVLPRGQDRRGDTTRQTLMQGLAKLSKNHGKNNHSERAIALKLGGLGVWYLTHNPTPEPASLRPARYVATARSWASLTPVILDRHPKDKPGQRLGDLIAQACENIGLPAPLGIEIHKHTPFKGAPSRDAMHLDPTSKLAERPRHHVVLHFAAPVQGPVLLGAGRFRGLGLCLPLKDRAS